jgi:hypothetical protein
MERIKNSVYCETRDSDGFSRRFILRLTVKAFVQKMYYVRCEAAAADSHNAIIKSTTNKNCIHILLK